jgi:hypothetical protein
VTPTYRIGAALGILIVAVDSKSRKFLIAMAVAVVPFCAVVWILLITVFGKPVVGVRCTRGGGPARCELLESGFLGIGDNSSFSIPESEIQGAETLRPLPHAGRGSGQYSASLVLKSGPYRHYPVVHSQFYDRADAATRRLNDYFANAGATSIEVREDSSEYAFPLLIPLGAVAIALIAIALRRRARRRDSCPATSE